MKRQAIQWQHLFMQCQSTAQPTNDEAPSHLLKQSAVERVSSVSSPLNQPMTRHQATYLTSQQSSNNNNNNKKQWSKSVVSVRLSTKQLRGSTQPSCSATYIFRLGPHVVQHRLEEGLGRFAHHFRRHATGVLSQTSHRSQQQCHQSAPVSSLSLPPFCPHPRLPLPLPLSLSLLRIQIHIRLTSASF